MTSRCFQRLPTGLPLDSDDIRLNRNHPFRSPWHRLPSLHCNIIQTTSRAVPSHQHKTIKSVPVVSIPVNRIIQSFYVSLTSIATLFNALICHSLSSSFWEKSQLHSMWNEAQMICFHWQCFLCRKLPFAVARVLHFSLKSGNLKSSTSNNSTEKKKYEKHIAQSGFSSIAHRNIQTFKENLSAFGL